MIGYFGQILPEGLHEIGITQDSTEGMGDSQTISNCRNWLNGLERRRNRMFVFLKKQNIICYK